MNSEKDNTNPSIIENGVHILSPINNDFEGLYLKLRSKERRVYTDEELLLLPSASTSNPHKKEWELRAQSFLRFIDYLKTKKNNLTLLDLGCGNGWFYGQLSKLFNNNYFCADINLTELKQAKKVFTSGNINFYYADIFAVDFAGQLFDIITINASAQYFPNLTTLINRLMNLLNENGEIHVLDSPFYENNESEDAKKRTIEYYSSTGFMEMAEFYFHHQWSELSAFNYKICYKPDSILNRIKKIFLFSDSPFPWIIIKK